MPIKVLMILFFIFYLNANDKNINQKITQNKNALENKKQKELQINKRLQELGDKLNQQKEESKTLEEFILQSEINIAKNEEEYIKKQNFIHTLTKTQKELFEKRKNIELEIINLITKDISFSILLNNFQPESIKDLIAEESFKVLNKNTKEHIAKLTQEQSYIIESLKNLQQEISKLKIFIDSENKKREALKGLQNKQKTLLSNYQKEISKYNRELKKIAQERESLQKILVQLNILKNQEEKKRQEEIVQAPETPKISEKKPAKETSSVKNAHDEFDVRQIASSYHNISTTKYKGEKTIAPLGNFTIEKRFGPYYDPIYKMKVFNESITLIPKGDNKVKSVLDGKVVYAKNTPILKHVIIIEHKNNMHTIYAQLDKIAPTIKPGSTVKKGYTIGRAENILKFEVTLKDKHIDPLELIMIKNI